MCTSVSAATEEAETCLPRSTTGAGAASPTKAKKTTTSNLTFTEGFCSNAGAHCKVVGDHKDLNAFGNELIFTLPLSISRNRIGYEQGECVNLQEASRSDFCTYNLHLPDGSISVQGTLPLTSRSSGAIPITGGTRAYLGAYGTPD